MRSRDAVVFVTLVELLSALPSCAPSSPAPALAPTAAPGSVMSAAATSAAVTPQPSTRTCRATPATIYGDEPARFEIANRGVASSEALDVSVFEERTGRLVYSAQLPQAGALEVPGLPSGDFTLDLAGPASTLKRANGGCTITVNRELSRAKSPSRVMPPPR